MGFITPAQFKRGLQEAKNYTDGVAANFEATSFKKAYIVGEILYRNDWLSDVENGDPISPINDDVYMINTDGKHYGQLFYWDEGKQAYRILGKKNILQNPVHVRNYSIKEYNIPYASYGSLNNGATPISIPVLEGDILHVDLSGTVNGMGIFIGFIGDSTVSGGPSISGYNWSYKKDIVVTPEIAALSTPFIWRLSSGGSAGQNAVLNAATITVEKVFQDYETADYVPPTNENDGQAGLVPALAKEDAVEALTPNGWDEIDFNITREELKQSFESASGIPSNNANTYSYDEIVIGTWVDGKPLYRRVWKFDSDINVNNNGWTETPILVGNIERIINSCASNSYGTSFGIMAEISSASNIRLQANRNNGTMPLDTLIIEYTKTTD